MVMCSVMTFAAKGDPIIYVNMPASGIMRFYV
jgi:hypothetical protein